MKKFKICLMIIILFLFTSGAFGFKSLIPSGSLDQINTEIIIGNYTWVNPGYTQTIDLCKPEKISIDEDEFVYSPFVYENYAAWVKGDYTYLWKKGGSTVKTTIPHGSDIYDLNDNKIIYKSAGKIYLYDVISKTKSQINISTPGADYPSYDNNELAYTDDNNTYFLSGLTAKKINSFINDKDYSRPSLHNGKIVWSEMTDKGSYQIFYWDNNTITQITSTKYDNFYPYLYNGKITWEGNKDGFFQIFYFDNNTITQVTNTKYDNYDPKLFNGKIVWYGDKDGIFQIFYWNGNNIKQLTNNNYYSLLPDIYNDRIVWRTRNSRGDYRDIYTCIAEKPSINVPSGQHIYTYLPVKDPILNIDPESASPFAVGNILKGTLSLKIGLKAFANPVDIYLAISYSGLPGNIFLIDSNGLHKNTIVPWKTNQTDAIDESLFGNINTADLPEGTYTLYTLVVPKGATNMNNSYLWLTSFNITH